jgi:hypothetical protein
MNNNGNSFWQALKTSECFKKTRVLLGVIIWCIKWAWRIYRLLEIIDKHSES